VREDFLRTDRSYLTKVLLNLKELTQVAHEWSSLAQKHWSGRDVSESEGSLFTVDKNGRVVALHFFIKDIITEQRPTTKIISVLKSLKRNNLLTH
jgi:hypothetical protein